MQKETKFFFSKTESLVKVNSTSLLILLHSYFFLINYSLIYILHVSRSQQSSQNALKKVGDCKPNKLQ